MTNGDSTVSSDSAGEARILIVDDTLQNIQVLGTILREQGYQLNVAQDGNGVPADWTGIEGLTQK